MGNTLRNEKVKFFDKYFVNTLQIFYQCFRLWIAANIFPIKISL